MSKITFLVCSAALIGALLAATAPLRADGIGLNIPPPNASSTEAEAEVYYSTNAFISGIGCGGSPEACLFSNDQSGTTHASASALDGVLTDASGAAFITAPGQITEGGAVAYGQGSATATEGHITANAVAYSPELSQVETTAEGTWSDTLTLTSGTLAEGTLVQLVAQLMVDANIAGFDAGQGDANAEFSGGADDGSAYGFDVNASKTVLPTISFGNSTDTETFTGFVGEQIPLEGSLEVIAEADGYEHAEKYGPSGLYVPKWSVEANNSAHFSINPLDPNVDVTLTSASGCNLSNGYGCDPLPSSETPEPGTLWLFGAGLLGLAWLSRRRAQSMPSARL